MPYDGLNAEERAYFAGINKLVAKPGELRQLRIFISHRWDQHRELYDQTTALIEDEFGAVQNLSVPEEKRLVGERGGDREKHELKAQLAARIYLSDIVIMPTNVGMVRKKDSTLFEVQLATLAYSVPTVFVTKEGQQRNIGIMGQAEALGLKHHIADDAAEKIAEGVKQLVTKQMLKGRFHSEGQTVVSSSRRPSDKVIHAVMRKYPYLKQNKSVSIFHTDEQKQAELERGIRRRKRDG